MALLHQRHIHFQSGANAGQRFVVQDIVAGDAETVGELHPELAMARIFAAEQIFSFFLHHIFQQHAAQLRNRALVIANAEKAMNVAKLMKLILRPPLELFLGQPSAQEQLANGMGPRMALL